MVINVGASAGTVGFCAQDFWSSDGCFCLSSCADYNPKFLYYFLKNNEQSFSGKVRRAGIPTLDAKVIEDFNLPVLPMNTQSEIVGILDKFESLTTDLTEGLPAEIKARQQQYEYYRDKLLRFKRAV